MGWVDTAPREHFETATEWRGWLTLNHSTSSGIFLVYWRSATGKPSMTYEEMVEQALCFGWVDSLQKGIDDERLMMWFSPRKPGSGWARPNKVRIERLTAAGLLAPAGIAVVEAAIADGSWTLLDSVENLEVPDDLAEAFELHPGSEDNFASFAASARKALLTWIAMAKTPATRARRIAETAERATRGERANEQRNPTETDG